MPSMLSETVARGEAADVRVFGGGMAELPFKIGNSEKSNESPIKTWQR